MAEIYFFFFLITLQVNCIALVVQIFSDVLDLVIVIPIVVVDITVVVVIFVGRENSVPIRYLDCAVAHEAHAVVVAQILEFFEVAVGLAALAAFHDLAHGCRLLGEGVRPR